ncbi:MAG: SAM-dependent methyltransferase [Pseudomonadota bacterium]
MTPVEERLLRRIALTGPISVGAYMSACLTDPDGYYCREEPFGADGDFVTAPEISQMFGEIIGAWLLERWYKDGTPSPVDLVELGPGRGTLMADILRVTRRDPRFEGASRVVLVEASDRLRKIQRDRLGPRHPRLDFAQTVPNERPIYLVANEFFDALPIRQFVRSGGKWFERTIGIVGERLGFGLSPYPAALVLEAPEGAVREISPVGEAMAVSIGAALSTHGVGAALLVDYGHSGAVGGETFQAVRRHKNVDVLEAPGEVDLSAHVDFAALARAASGAGACAHGPVGQGDFLVALGLLERAGQLGAGLDRNGQAGIQAAVERLAGTGKDQMGALFKVLALTPSSTVPLGFCPPEDGSRPSTIG